MARINSMEIKLLLVKLLQLISIIQGGRSSGSGSGGSRSSSRGSGSAGSRSSSRSSRSASGESVTYSFSGSLGRYDALINGKLKLAEAVEECERLNATLLSIHSQSEQDFLLSQQSQLDGDDFYWIGLCYKSDTNEWAWEDGTDMNYSNWAPISQKKPGAGGSGGRSVKRDCAKMSSDSFQWSVDEENKKHSYICKSSDNESPVFNVPPTDVTSNNDAAKATATVTWIEPIVTDNAGLFTVTCDYNSGDEFPIGTTLVTYTAVDATGNNATSAFNITVIDNEKPVFISTPSDVIKNTDANRHFATVTWTEPTATDNSGSYNIQSTYNSGDIFSIGITVVTYTAADSSGNQETFTFTITVNAMSTTMSTTRQPSTFGSTEVISSKPSTSSSAQTLHPSDLIGTSVEQQCNSYTLTASSNLADAGVFKVANISSKMKCARQCLASNRCISFAYDVFNKQCYLKQQLGPIDDETSQTVYYVSDT